MSARKPDAWIISHDGKPERVISYEPHCPFCVVKPLYALTDADLEAIRWGAEQAEAWMRYMDNEGITPLLKPEAIAKRHTLAAALRSITDERK